MATISFYADELGIQNLNGSGLGFFGSSGFGQSVEVGAWQGTTYMTDGTGSVEGAAVINNQWSNASGVVNSTIGTTHVHIQEVPNRLATLNIRFTHDSAVKLQNSKLRIFDRSNINNAASGVTTKVAQIIHPDTVQGVGGSGDATWNTPGGSAVIMDLLYSPGESGAYGTNTTHTDTRHDYFVLISASPDSIGSKTLYGLYIQTEYL